MVIRHAAPEAGYANGSGYASAALRFWEYDPSLDLHMVA